MKTITSSVTGRIWMDRNIGAYCRAIYPSHIPSYGTHHTWDEAMKISKNILGFRLPTIEELLDEQIQDSTDAIKKLAMPSAGSRGSISGSPNLQGSFGYLWSSSFSGPSSRLLYFCFDNMDSYIMNQTNGFSVRLIKEQ